MSPPERQALAARAACRCGSRTRCRQYHDLTAARELVLPEARPYLKDLPVLADSVMKGPARACSACEKASPGELDIDTKTATRSAIPSLPGERGFALMSQRWRAIQHVSLSRPPSATSSNPHSSSRIRAQDDQLKVMRNSICSPGLMSCHT